LIVSSSNRLTSSIVFNGLSLVSTTVLATTTQYGVQDDSVALFGQEEGVGILGGGEFGLSNPAEALSALSP